MSEKDVIKAVIRDPLREQIIRTVADLKLPDGWIAGGFVRNAFWDVLFDSSDTAPINDVDVAYYRPLDTYDLPLDALTVLIEADEANPVWEEEKRLERTLNEKFPGIEFEVKNQARMHISARRLVKRAPYVDSADAIGDWVETATATGIRFREGVFELLIPHGLEDLVAGIVRPTSRELSDRARERARNKGWFERWPRLRFEEYL